MSFLRLSEQILYIIFSDNGVEEYLLEGIGAIGVIEPQVYHKVKFLTSDASFYVAFFATDESSLQIPKFIP
jgi:tellurite resistance-related uncharacterized protein